MVAVAGADGPGWALQAGGGAGGGAGRRSGAAEGAGAAGGQEPGPPAAVSAAPSPAGAPGTPRSPRDGAPGGAGSGQGVCGNAVCSVCTPCAGTARTMNSPRQRPALRTDVVSASLSAWCHAGPWLSQLGCWKPSCCAACKPSSASPSHRHPRGAVTKALPR